MYILGSGLAGLLAGNLMKRHNPVIIEKQKAIPENHNAVLRHRDDKIARATLIPFKKVRVAKALNYEGKLYTEATPKLANMYSLKVTNKILGRSIMNLSPVDRYIAPPDFTKQLAKVCDIKTGVDVDLDWIEKHNSVPIISTIPMPILCRILNFELESEFQYKNVITAYTFINDPVVDVYQTIYYPNPSLGLYRMSITGNKVMAEFVFDDFTDPDPRHGVDDLKGYISHFLSRDFGFYPCDMNEIKLQKSRYGKISPIDESERKKIIHQISKDYNIFSLGRFATWRNLLLDDVYDDVFEIENMIKKQGVIS